MPIYEYKCRACDENFDVEQSITEDSLTSLPGCDVTDDGDHALKKVFSAVGISFKGEGFYKNDSRRGSDSGSSSSSDSSSSSSSSSDSGSESSSSDSSNGSSSSSSSSSSSDKSSSDSSSSKTSSSSTGSGASSD